MEAKSKKKKVWAYSPCHSFTLITPKGSIDSKMQSQLYKIGVYVILDDNPSMQFGLTPARIMGVEKKLKKDEIAGKITNLVFSSPIKVTTDDDGFFIQIEDE